MLLNVLVMSHVKATKNAIPGCVVLRDEQGEKGFRPPMEIYLALCDILAGYTPSALIGPISLRVNCSGAGINLSS